MKKIILSLLAMFSNAQAYEYKGVFYCVYQSEECVESSAPINVDKTKINKLLERVLERQKNFIGFVDDSGTTLQFYVDELDKVWVEVPSPADKGGFGKHLSNREVRMLIKALKPPYLEYINTLNLQLEKW